MIKERLNLTISNKIPSREEVDLLLSKIKPKYKEGIQLAVQKGMKLKDIEKIVKNVSRRATQEYLHKISLEVLGYSLTFEQLRQFFMIDLINKGYTPEFIQKEMGYSRNNKIKELLK